MVLLILRGLFICFCLAIAFVYASQVFHNDLWNLWLTLIAAICISSGLVLVDILWKKKQLWTLSGAFFGLIVGMVAAFAINESLIPYLMLPFREVDPNAATLQRLDLLEQGINIFVGAICVFAAISMILQTKNDFRFVIPYVEFSKQLRGQKPMLLDTSAIIDGRILDIAETQILQGNIILPRFVIQELQTIADAHDKLKRTRGRRGLDIVTKLQQSPHVDLTIDEQADVVGAGVDQKLISLAEEMRGRIITTDFNLAKVAEVRSIEVININALANAMRAVVLPGESLEVKIVKPGEAANQGVGYLEDGTMVVVENARDHMNETVQITVTSALQTAAGRMIFGKVN